MIYRNIYKTNNRYIIKKSIYNKTIVYGSFDRLSDAIEHRDKLARNNWYKNATTGYPLNQRFPQYYVKEIECGYLVINKKNGRTFGTYKNCKYARIIKKILPFYEDDLNISQVEKIAHKEFYKYITYHKMLGRYHVVYEGVVRSTHKNLVDALYERDLIVKYNGNEELMCEDPTTIHDYSNEELPSFTHECENIYYKDENKNKYQLEKQIRNNKLIIGNYPTYNLACLIKRYLDSKKWNKKDVKHIMKITKKIHKRDKYIHRRNGRYCVERTVNKKRTIYGYYDNIEQARYVKIRLEETSWKKKQVPKFERNYYKHKNITRYYYDTTDFFKTEG
ncbi:hypothetical protein PXD04_00835 [Methanosphaera sp. ISO3-F5]|uniref:hypothetical protein n=1 Tax=Methanosphaera sp. ISO3-F5 TaxID=1452353 RepID=UPI002B263639|nr:hypothetical protein [Methanosphaera sp. ISO3-F5]WQH64373.1 hypothetical protein PXD04_00835 [Methanosphaera sp. ISO3-F5]